MSQHSQNIYEEEYHDLLRFNSHSLEELLLKLTALSAKSRRNPGKTAIITKVQTICQKIQLQLAKYEQSINKSKKKVLSKGAISSLKAYFISNFNSLTREAHQLINMSQNRLKQPCDEDFFKMKAFEHEMGQDWDRINGVRDPSPEKTRVIDRSKLSEKAASLLHQQFLAIRMIAYKMYEQYSDHTHAQLSEELKGTLQQQEKLGKQIQQAKLSRTELLHEEKKLSEELKELKKINELIGRRYFLHNSVSDTNFTEP